MSADTVTVRANEVAFCNLGLNFHPRCTTVQQCNPVGLWVIAAMVVVHDVKRVKLSAVGAGTCFLLCLNPPSEHVLSSASGSDKFDPVFNVVGVSSFLRLL